MCIEIIIVGFLKTNDIFTSALGKVFSLLAHYSGIFSFSFGYVLMLKRNSKFEKKIVAHMDKIDVYKNFFIPQLGILSM